MSNSITLPASMQPPAPPPGALDNPASPNEPTVHYQLSSGQIASLPQSSVDALMKQDAGAKQIPSPEAGQVLVQLSSGHTATVPSTSIHALKQQEPGFKYIAGDTTSPDTASHQDLLGAIQAATVGPTTALGTPVSPELRQEGSGVLDLLHGNVRQGAGKIWDSEKPHVIQGSLLERAIQKVDPSFQGSVSNDQVAQHAASFDVGSHPLVDVASSIDKEKSPAAKAIAETAQGFTTPDTIATMAATGGLGLVKSPAALGMASKLISLGFSATAIADAYKHSVAFKDAYDSGDRSEAIYQITHAITSGTLGVLAGRDALSKVPIPNPFRKTSVVSADAVSAANAARVPISPGTSAVTEAPTVESLQPQVQGNLRNTVDAVAKNEGLQPVASNTSISDVGKSLGDQFYARSKSIFGQIKNITGIDLNILHDQIGVLDDKIADAIDNPEKAGQLEQQKIGLENQAADAAKKFQTATGIDPQQALTDWKKYNASYDFGKQVRMATDGRPGIGTGEVVDPNKLAPRLNKMTQSNSPTQPGRLQQFMGDDLAKNLADNTEVNRGVIRDFTPTTATGQQALQDIIRQNTGTSRIATYKQALGFSPKTDWVGVYKNFNALTPEEQAAQFGNEANAAQTFIKSQAKFQVGKMLAKGAGIALVVHLTGADKALLHLILGSE